MAKKDDVYISFIKFMKAKTAETGTISTNECRDFLAAEFPDLHKSVALSLIGDISKTIFRPAVERGPERRELKVESYFRLLEHTELEEARASSKWALRVAIFAIVISTVVSGINIYQQVNAGCADCAQTTTEAAAD